MGEIKVKQIEYKDTSDDSVMDVDTEKRTAKVIWSRLGNKDLDEDIILPTAYTKTISERGPLGKQLIWALTDHRASLKHAIGKPTELYVDGDKLVAVTKILDTPFGDDVAKMYNAGLINQHSVGFSTIQSEYDTNTEVRTLKELMLYEGSAVLWGANPETQTIEMMKGLSFDEQKTGLNKRLELLLKGFKHGTYTDETFSLIEIEIKQIQQLIDLITTPPAPKGAVKPEVPKSLFDAFQSLNKSLTIKN